MEPLHPGVILHFQYQIQQLIGQGGYAAVYKAVDRRLNQNVAVKQLLRINDPLSRQFILEAELLENLKHPLLLRGLDHFSTTTGQFLVMEYIPGDNLGQQLVERASPFAVPKVLQWADQLLDVVTFLHGQSPPIIHCDIKPTNIMLTENGDIKLIDLGLAARLVGSRLSPDLGSLMVFARGLAPPELIEGTGVGVQSDLYSFSATLYCLLTATFPAEAQTRLLLTMRNRPDPVKLAHQLNPQVPQEVSTLLSRGLALEMEDRPTAVEMRRVLRSAMHSSHAFIEAHAHRVTHRGIQQMTDKRETIEREPDRMDVARDVVSDNVHGSSKVENTGTIYGPAIGNNVGSITSNYYIYHRDEGSSHEVLRQLLCEEIDENLATLQKLLDNPAEYIDGSGDLPDWEMAVWTQQRKELLPLLQNSELQDVSQFYRDLKALSKLQKAWVSWGTNIRYVKLSDKQVEAVEQLIFTGNPLCK